MENTTEALSTHRETFESANETTSEPRMDVSPVEKINDLFKDMGSQKQQLLAIIDFCRTERTSEEIDEMLEPLREHRMSVYDGIALRALLEQAGALLYISNDEEPEEVFDEEGSLVLPEPAVCTWLATDEGIACLEADDPFRDLLETLEDTTVPAEGFALVLELCNNDNVKITDITRKLEESGIMEDADYDPTVFVSKLEDAGALEWRGSWTTTDLGKRYLAESQA